MTNIRSTDYSRRVTTVTAPDYVSNPVVTVEELKEELRGVADNETDAFLQSKITAATIFAEKYTNKCFVSRTLSLSLDWFPGEAPQARRASRNVNRSVWQDNAIVLDCVPITAVNSIKYYNQDSDETVMDPTEYRLDPSGDNAWQARVAPTADNYCWPDQDTYRRQNAAVVVEFAAGYADANTDTPQDIKQAILTLSVALYEGECDCSSSDCSIPCDAQLILNQNRVIHI